MCKVADGCMLSVCLPLQKIQENIILSNYANNLVVLCCIHTVKKISGIVEAIPPNNHMSSLLFLPGTYVLYSFFNLGTVDTPQLG